MCGLHFHGASRADAEAKVGKASGATTNANIPIAELRSHIITREHAIARPSPWHVQRQPQLYAMSGMVEGRPTPEMWRAAQRSRK